MEINFVINGEPFGKQRHRVGMCNGHARAYNTRDNILYENKVMCAYKDIANDYTFSKDVPLEIDIVAYFSLSSVDFNKSGLSKSGKKKMSQLYCTKKSDIDNIIKSVMDGLNKVAYIDDKQIASVSAKKLYTQDMPKVVVTIKDITPPNYKCLLS